MPLEAGSVIDGRYKIGHEIGSGASSTVYQAHDLILNIDIALKVFDKAKASIESAEKLKAEAKILSQLASPYIVRIFKFGFIEGETPFLALELVEGRSLRELISEKQRFKCKDALKLAIGIARALEAAHEKGVIHRDLKPENIMISENDDGQSVKLLDFGLSKIQTDGKTLTSTRSMAGSIHYMSPEQCSGKGVDGRADIYALGCILFEMICANPPFQAESAGEVMLQQLNSPPPSILALAPKAGFPRELDKFINKCLQKDKKSRFSNMKEVLAELKSLDSLESSASFDLDREVSSGKRKLPKAALFVTFASLALAIAAFVYYLNSDEVRLKQILSGGYKKSIVTLQDELKRRLERKEEGSAKNLIRLCLQASNGKNWSVEDRERLFCGLARICLQYKMKDEAVKLYALVLDSFTARVQSYVRHDQPTTDKLYKSTDFSYMKEIDECLSAASRDLTDTQKKEIIRVCRGGTYQFTDDNLPIFHLRCLLISTMDERYISSNYQCYAKDLMCLGQLASVHLHDRKLAEWAMEKLSALASNHPDVARREFQAKVQLGRLYLGKLHSKAGTVGDELQRAEEIHKWADWKLRHSDLIPTADENQRWVLFKAEYEKACKKQKTAK